MYLTHNVKNEVSEFAEAHCHLNGKFLSILVYYGHMSPKGKKTTTPEIFFPPAKNTLYPFEVSIKLIPLECSI